MKSLYKNQEDWRMQRTEMEDWMTDHQIPDDLQNRICQFLGVQVDFNTGS